MTDLFFFSVEHKWNTCLCLCFWWQILGPLFPSQKYADISWVDLGVTEALCVCGSFTNPDWFISGKQIRNVNVPIRSEVKYKTSFSMQISVNSSNICSNFWKNISCFGKKESNKKPKYSISIDVWYLLNNIEGTSHFNYSFLTSTVYLICMPV